MSYRTYINDTQLFGNNEYYPEWITYLKSKGIEENEDGCYEGELTDFMEALDVIEEIVMNMEKERRENKKNGERFHATSIFDLGNIYDNVLNNPTEESLLDKEMHYVENGYMFLPYAFYKACEDIIEYKGIGLGKHIRIYELKKGCKITVSAG